MTAAAAADLELELAAVSLLGVDWKSPLSCRLENTDKRNEFCTVANTGNKQM